jgi:PEGA domain
MPGGARAWVLAVATAAALFCPAPADAQSPQARKLAGAHFQKGISLFEANSFAAALTEFRAAYDAAPSYEVLWNIGLCQRRLFQYGDAAATFDAYLKEGGKRLSKERRAAVAEELAKVRSLTAGVTVRVSTGAAEVFIDGERVGFTPLDRHLVGPGKKVIRVVREGFKPHEEIKDLIPGDQIVLSIDLEPIAGYVPQKPAPLPRQTEPVPERTRAFGTASAPAEEPVSRPRVPVLGVAALAGGAAFIGGGIAFEANTRAINSDITRLFDAGGTWNDRWAKRAAWGETSRTLGVVCFVVGSALLGTGAVVTVFSLRKPPTQPALTEVSMTPLPGGGLAFSLGGVF